MSRTLLYTVQRVLEKLNLDPVNSISDTEHALLVSREAESTYYDMLSRADWPDTVDLIHVDSVSDLNNPAALKLRGNVHFIKSVRYDVSKASDHKKSIKELTYLEPETFLDRSYCLSTSEDNVFISDYKGKPIFIRTDKAPEYYTSFDNKTVLFDSLDQEEEDTLNHTKTLCYGKVSPDWIQEDEYVIPVQDSVYPLYLASLTSACALYLDSQLSQEDERRQARGISRMRREAFRVEVESLPKVNYGRKGNGLS